MQVLRVRQHGVGLGAEEVDVPDVEQAEQDRQRSRSSGRGAEVLVDRVEAGEHLAGSRPGRWRASATARPRSRRSSVRRPSPRSRTCWPCRCRSRPTCSALVETATKCLATAAAGRRRAPVEQPRAGRRGVGQRLLRGERLRRDDEQRRRRVEVAGGSRRRRWGRCWRRTGSSMPRSAYALAAPRRPSPGPRSEPPMPMLTTVRIRSPVCPVHCPERTASVNVGHPVQHRVHVGDARPGRRRPARRPAGQAQRGVQDRPVLAGVDVLAREHGVDPLGQPGRARPARPAAASSRG